MSLDSTGPPTSAARRCAGCDLLGGDLVAMLEVGCDAEGSWLVAMVCSVSGC